MLAERSRPSQKRQSKAKQQGFTLIELVMVIVLLGVVAVGASSLIKLSSQTFVNVTSRDELLASARFSVERLNREVRDALPNSIRIATNATSTVECLEFTPISASTIYTELAVVPAPAENSVTVIKFYDDSGSEYACNGSCSDNVVVYPITSEDVYSATTSPGKRFALNSVSSTATEGVWTLTLASNVQFEQHSATERLYLISKPVSYCVSAGEITRYANYGFDATQQVPPAATESNTAIMAKHLGNIGAGQSAFSYSAATLQRNALVEIALHFSKNGEKVVFNNQMRIRNVP